MDYTKHQVSTEVSISGMDNTTHANDPNQQVSVIPYDVFLGIVDALIEAAETRVAQKPSFWQFNALSRYGEPRFFITNGYMSRPALITDDDNKERFCLFQNIVQVDQRTRNMVLRTFFRLPARHTYRPNIYQYQYFWFYPKADRLQPFGHPRTPVQVVKDALTNQTPLMALCLQKISKVQHYGISKLLDYQRESMEQLLGAFPSLKVLEVRAVDLGWADDEVPVKGNRHVDHIVDVVEFPQLRQYTENEAGNEALALLWENKIRILLCGLARPGSGGSSIIMEVVNTSNGMRLRRRAPDYDYYQEAVKEEDEVVEEEAGAVEEEAGAAGEDD
ncbi:hypothetical protein C8035_v009937 [Colletotrichum spinosum]|uniref:Uncharacterized protein n=1 Tax=Colletotrichum spinosum TaxID=1347390 RepID=A0A4R8Q918_9PEZI|nr:hypothetical protein C8035_v009937 [Colletotrichum spinosum]